jgi:glycosyltransferase involved in cell wall biosynthesis
MESMLRRLVQRVRRQPPPEALPKSPYELWIENNRWNATRATLLESRLAAATDLPAISVIMPVYNPPLRWLERAIESVMRQVYPRWELCIADDASTDREVRRRLQWWSGRDSRIRVVFRPRNGNICRATNSAVELATAPFLAFLDQDDELSPDALAEVALHAGDADILYSDDDKIDAAGRRFAPQLKPDWSPELLLCFKYFSHLTCVRRSLYLEVGGERPGFEGGQDYDLVLRMAERTDRVRHIPKILYHWRVLPGSTAQSGDAKPASLRASERAVQEALDRRGMNAVAYQPDWAVRARCGIFLHRFPARGPRVSILIATRNRRDLLQRCLESLATTAYDPFEVIVVDNDSDDADTLRYLESLPHKVLRVPGKFNFAALNNRAAREASGEYLLFLNNDTEVQSPDWLAQMVGWAARPNVGAVGAKLLYPDGTVQHGGVLHGCCQGMPGHAFKHLHGDDPGYMGLAGVVRNCSAVTAACMLTPKALFLELGGFDEREFGVAYNDVDYCYRLIDRGLRVVYSPTATLLHHEGGSRGFHDAPEEHETFRRKHGARVDRYHNPHLSLENERFEIRVGTRAEPHRRPIRALMFSHNLNLEGAPASQLELAVRLQERGRIAPVIVSPSDGPLRAEYEARGIEVQLVRNPFQGGLDDAIERIRQMRPDLVYANTVLGFYAIEAAQRTRVPSIWNVRESEPWTSLFGDAPAVIERAKRCFAHPYRVVFVADATRQLYQPYATRHNFATIHNGLDLARLQQAMARWPRPTARRELDLHDGELAVVCVGTVCDRKGQEDLVEAWRRLPAELVSTMRCFLVGDRAGAYSRGLHARIAAMAPSWAERIHLIAETGEVARYLSAADLFVCTSRIESYPRVILEAMAAGLPIITTPVFGIVQQVRENVNAMFYAPGDAAGLAWSIAALAADDERRREMAKKSPHVLGALGDLSTMVHSYEELFREAWLAEPLP